MGVAVKICGLKTSEAVSAAAAGGARSVGFVFFPRSPRAVSPAQAAQLVTAVPSGVEAVAVVVDADDRSLEAILTSGPFGWLQCHGKETVARIAEIRDRFGVNVIKALPIADRDDLAAVAAYEDVADRILFDSRAPADAGRPGGNAIAFDWSLLRSRPWRRPWLLAGGLDAGNLTEAVRMSGAEAVDVSSGVEEAPGEKSIAKIRQFLALANTL
jgi:Phosphoribosylanthranilate isomerase